jgi:ABC-type glutathione transport system ATPase component
VDGESKQRIHEAISRLAGRCATFIIAHRLSTLQRVDRLLVLEEGRLVEVGTREQLVDRRQAFYRFVHMEQARIPEMTTGDDGKTDARADIPPTHDASVPPSIDTMHPVDAQAIRFFRCPPWKLRPTISDRSYLHVVVMPAAPLSHPDRYIVILDGDGAEVCFLRDPADLEPRSRQVLAEELRARDLTGTIQRIDVVREEMGLTHFAVRTDRGPRGFALRRAEENVRRLGDRRLLLVDLDGNRFTIPDVNALDKRSARLLEQVL